MADKAIEKGRTEGELEKASRTHANQAKKLGVILDTLKKAKEKNS